MKRWLFRIAKICLASFFALGIVGFFLSGLKADIYDTALSFDAAMRLYYLGTHMKTAATWCGVAALVSGAACLLLKLAVWMRSVKGK